MPNVFLVGAMKAGTTALASTLGSHYDVLAGYIKEPNYFCQDLHSSNIAAKDPHLKKFDIKLYLAAPKPVAQHHAFITELNDYLRLYREHQAERCILDASTSYLYSVSAPGLIKRTSPHAKIIIVTRDPVERAWSEFCMNQMIGVCDRDFVSALRREARILRDGGIPLFERYVFAGLYERQIAKYVEIFGAKRVFISDFKKLVERPDQLISELCDFLGIESVGLSLRPENRSVLPRFPRLNRTLRRTGLKSAAGRVLPGWVKDWIKAKTFRADQSSVPQVFRREFLALHREFSCRPPLEIRLNRGAAFPADLEAAGAVVV